MSQDNDLDIRIAAITDQSSFNKAEKSINSVADVADKATTEINAQAKSSKLLSTNYLQLAKGAEQYNAELREMSGNLDNVGNAKTPSSPVPSSSGGGGLGGAGAAKGAVRGLLGGSAIAEAADTLGDLSEVAGGLIQSSGGATQALLAFGPAALAVGIAVAAAAFVMGEYNKTAQAQADILGAAIDAQRQLNSEIAAGLTNEEASEKAERLNTEIALQAELLADLEAQYAKMSETLGAATGAAQLFDAREEELSNQINQQKALVTDLTAEQNAYNTAVENGLLDANDAAAAQENLSAKTQDFNSVLQQAQSASSKQATTTRDLTKASQEFSSSATRAASSLSQASSMFSTAARAPSATGILGRGKRVGGAKSPVDNSLKELQASQTEYANSLIGISNDVGKSVDDIKLNLSRSLQDLSINTGRNIEDALAEGAFLSIRDIQKEAKRESQDLERQASRDRLDAQREGALEAIRVEQEFWQARTRLIPNGKGNQGAGRIFGASPR